jgi:hypothetical protein
VCVCARAAVQWGWGRAPGARRRAWGRAAAAPAAAAHTAQRAARSAAAAARQRAAAHEQHVHTWRRGVARGARARDACRAATHPGAPAASRTGRTTRPRSARAAGGACPPRRRHRAAWQRLVRAPAAAPSPRHPPRAAAATAAATRPRAAARERAPAATRRPRAARRRAAARTTTPAPAHSGDAWAACQRVGSFLGARACGAAARVRVRARTGRTHRRHACRWRARAHRTAAARRAKCAPACTFPVHAAGGWQVAPPAEWPKCNLCTTGFAAMLPARRAARARAGSLGRRPGGARVTPCGRGARRAQPRPGGDTAAV